MNYLSVVGTAAIAIVAILYLALNPARIHEEVFEVVANNPSGESRHVLGSAGSHGDAHDGTQEQRTVHGTFTVPHDLWVTTFSAEPHSLPFEAIESIVVSEPGASDELCPSRPKLLWSVDTTTAREPRPIPAPYGIFLAKGTRVDVTATLVGHTNTAASITVLMTTEPDSQGTRTKKASYHIVTPAACGTPAAFKKSEHAGTTRYDSSAAPFSFPVSGTVLGARAHLHGTYPPLGVLRLFFKGDEAETFSAASVTDEASRNRRIFIDRTPLPVSAGDTLSMAFETPESGYAAPDESTLFLCFYFSRE